MTTPIRHTDITATHWQPALGTPGEVAIGLRDIDQAIRIILNTPQGSDPHRPEFGSRIHLYLDWPTNRVVPHLVREAIESIARWEPRVTVVRIATEIDATHITLRAQWRVQDGLLQTSEVSHARAATA
jgi:phage baseplate assembly protein W